MSQPSNLGHSESVLERWKRLDALLAAECAVAALREAVQALEMIATMPGETGEMAEAAIMRVEHPLNGGVAEW